MKFYKRDPDAALAGMAELTLKQRGAYNSLIDLLYSRDGDVPDDDRRVAKMIGCHWREWETLKRGLIACGKVWIEDGLLKVEYEAMERTTGLHDIRFDVAITTQWRLCPRDLGCLVTIIGRLAHQMVWTYDAPVADPSLPANDLKALAKECGLPPRDLIAAWPQIERHFSARDGRIRLKEAWFDIRPQSRIPLPDELKKWVAVREGDACAYCGCTAGPFDYDHILPLVKGGDDSPNNIALACAPCNRSKGGRSLREWMVVR